MDTNIPSSSAIQAAKEKRDRLKNTGASASEDYISLSVTKRNELPQGPHPESRLMREEDELGEGDDGETYFRLSRAPYTHMPTPQNMLNILVPRNALRSAKSLAK